MKLGILESVDIRSVWTHEQYDFSAWLAKEENIVLLNDVLGLTLTDIKQEVYVGPYRCDIVAKDETTGIRVIIENQLAPSNHDHLGKIITYASGLDAAVVVWIVEEAKSEHRSAIEWLNNKTDSSVLFFLLEIQACKIGNSLPAPRFQLVEEPNNFRKNTRNMELSGANNQTQAERLSFWTQFNDIIEAEGKPFNVRKATTDHWYNVALGTSVAYISITLVQRDSNIGVEIYIPNNKEVFDVLKQESLVIESELNCSVEWLRLDDKAASRIVSYIDGLDFNDHSNYPTLMRQVIERVILFKRVFAQRIKSLV